jgi:uncharacterized protein (TIGR02117 family)
MLFAGAAAALTTACAWTPVEPYKGATPRTDTVYLAALGWHTEIGLRADTITGPLAALEREFPGASYFTFGWGERGYYMAADPGVADLLRALLPRPAVMLVRALHRSPAETFGNTNVYAVLVSREGMDRLSRYLWEYLDKDGQGQLHRAADGPYPESAFYGSAGTYDIANTCNTWTAEALNVAGLPVSAAGVVFADQVVDSVRGLAIPASRD